jgi:hypothetical protein
VVEAYHRASNGDTLFPQSGIWWPTLAKDGQGWEKSGHGWARHGTAWRGEQARFDVYGQDETVCACMHARNETAAHGLDLFLEAHELRLDLPFESINIGLVDEPTRGGGDIKAHAGVGEQGAGVSV